MTIEIIAGLVVAALIAVAGAFGLGNARGKNRAEAAAAQQKTQETAEAVKAVAEKRIDATKGAQDVKQTVNHLPDDAVDRELRENFTRKT